VPLQFVLSTTGCAANIHYEINFLAAQSIQELLACLLSFLFIAQSISQLAQSSKNFICLLSLPLSLIGFVPQKTRDNVTDPLRRVKANPTHSMKQRH